MAAESTTLPVALPTLVPGNGLDAYMREIHKIPMLTADEEYMLAKRLQEHQDMDAAHRMVTSHLRLVSKIAMGFRGYGLPLAELISEGSIGLMQAVKKFDPDRGFRLATYAMWWIRAAIQEYILRSWSMVKVGTSAAQKRLFFNLKKQKQRLDAYDDNTDLTPENVRLIAEELDVKDEEVVAMNQRMIASDQSLNAPVGMEGESQWIDYLADPDADQEEVFGEREELDYRRSLFERAMDELNPREQDVLRSRRLMEPALTLEELSQKYSISRERVRQIENRAMEKVQQSIQDLHSA